MILGLILNFKGSTLRLDFFGPKSLRMHTLVSIIED